MTTKGLSSSFFGLNSSLPLSIPSDEAPLRPLQNSAGLLSRAWRWIRARQAGRSSPQRLRVAATVSLGEKRFVAVIQVDGLQFLIGGGATNVALLAQLHAKDSFGDLLNETRRLAQLHAKDSFGDLLNETRRLAQLHAKDSFGDILNDSMLVSKMQTVERTRELIAKPTAENTGESA